jgi:TetR/AcrR family transcriptional repressor of bet genes
MENDSMAKARPTGPGPARSRAANKAFRRRQIIEATIDTISTRGLAETTVATVAESAGVSHGMLMFHFKTKDALLVETLNFLSAEYGATWQAALAAAPDDPIARILALIAADFEPKVCARKKVAVWHAFFGEARARPTYLALYGELDEERTEVMHRLCAAALSEEPSTQWTADIATACIERLADGLWLQLLLGTRRTERREALRVIHQLLLSIFPSRDETIRAALAKALGRPK